MRQISIIGYGNEYEEYVNEVGEGAEDILKSQMDRIAKLFGFKEAYFQ